MTRIAPWCRLWLQRRPDAPLLPLVHPAVAYKECRGHSYRPARETNRCCESQSS